MKYITPKELLELLIQDGLLEGQGFSGFEFLNVKTQGNNKNTIGYLFQDWLSDWMTSKDIYHRSPLNTQVPPDFYLSEEEDQNLLEIKVFDYSATPNFDIANYQAYCDSLLVHPYKVDSDYLIFGYTLESGVFKIRDVWLKKVWEISCRMGDFPIRVQKKRKVVYNIRPVKWYSTTRGEKPFDSRELFLSALQDSLSVYDFTKDNMAIDWLKNFNNAYSNWQNGLTKES